MFTFTLTSEASSGHDQNSLIFYWDGERLSEEKFFLFLNAA